VGWRASDAIASTVRKGRRRRMAKEGAVAARASAKETADE
jgi:hypothetical protein